MAPDGSGGIRNCSTGMKSKHTLKKGPWTANEDMMLVEYVKNHGEGNWNAVQRNSGLMRCGKSCRLRWANHLRPNLKKGAFSGDEEKLIVELHSKLGNKWARMAAQLPGRTDNEIKNYWNTRLKRRQRAGLPVYPQELHQGQHQQLHSSSHHSLSSLLLASSAHHTNTNPLNFFNSFNSINRPMMQPNLKLFHDNNSSSLTLSLAAANNPAFSSSSLRTTPFFNQGLSNPLPMPSVLQYNFINFTPPGLGVSSELPSIQSTVTPVGSSSDRFMIETSSDDAEDYDDPGYMRRKNSGLLEDLLGESQALTCPEKTENSCIAPPENEHEQAIAFCHGGDKNNLEGRNEKGFSEGDEDLLNLLDNFPMAIPIPDWDEGNGSDGSSTLANGKNGTVESQAEGSQYNTMSDLPRLENQEWNIGSNLWNNMPTIY